MEFIGYEILVITKPFSTDLILKFKNEGLSKEQFEFLKDRLENYNLEITSDLRMTFDTLFNEESGNLLMGIIITISDRLIPKEPMEFVEIIEHHKKRFMVFYERLKAIRINYGAVHFRVVKNRVLEAFNGFFNQIQLFIIT